MKSIKNVGKRFGSLMAKGASVAMATVATAHAAIPTEATAAMTELTTDIGTWIGLGFGIAAVSVAGFTGIKLFKKTANKAT